MQAAIVYITIFLVFLGFVFFLVSSGVKSGSRFKNKPLMTANEIEFFGRLCAALPEYYVFPQVAAGAILDAAAKPGEKDKNGKSKVHSARGKFSQKIIDYIICDKELNVLVLIELDDKTHNSKSDRERDAMMNEAGYKVIRWQSVSKPSIEKISSEVQSILKGAKR